MEVKNASDSFKQLRTNLKRSSRSFGWCGTDLDPGGDNLETRTQTLAGSWPCTPTVDQTCEALTTKKETSFQGEQVE